MKETGIIMSGNHPKLILDGIKTQTRRVIKLKNYHRNVWDYCVPHNGESAELLGEPYLKVPYDAVTDNAGTRITCPYGQAGDRLWVKETWRIIGRDSGKTALQIQYKSDMSRKWVSISQSDFNKYTYNSGWGVESKWRPSIFMPRWASRITLEITEVRVERLQEINREDSLAEGVSWQDYKQDYKWAFAKLWDSLNAKRGYGWEVNPWVWVISFRRIDER